MTHRCTTSPSSTTPYETMCATIEQHSLLPTGGAALLMVSGGSDSVALAYLMATYRAQHPEILSALTMLHMNHKLRGAAADGDAHFVETLAAALEIPLFLCEMDIGAEAARTGENIEALARRERYAAAAEALHSMCQHEGIPLADASIITAHTVDDRIENFYMRSIVGTGPGGFRSMLFENGRVKRPLLACTRAELRSYLEMLADQSVSLHDDGVVPVRDEDGALWREDATNAHTDRFRAYVRHEIIPQARAWNAQLDQTLTRTMDLIADEDDMLEEMAATLLDETATPITESGFADGVVLAPDFAQAPLPLQRRAIQNVLKGMLGAEERINAASVAAVLNCFEDGVPKSGHVDNIQGNLAVSSNKQGVRIEPMSAFRARRKRS